MYTLYLTSYRALLNTHNAFLLPSMMGLLWFISTSPSLWGSHPEDRSESSNFRLALPSYTNTNYFLAENDFPLFFLRILNTKESSAITSVPPGKVPEAPWVSSPVTFRRFCRPQHSTTQIQMIQMYLWLSTNMFCLILKPSYKHPEWWYMFILLLQMPGLWTLLFL